MGKKKSAPRKRASSKTTARKSSTRKTTSRKSAPSKSTARKTTAGKSQSREAKVTTDHNEIRRWVESRGGKPATVKKFQHLARAANEQIVRGHSSGAQAVEPVADTLLEPAKILVLVPERLARNSAALLDAVG